jgi:hypothetical protein
MPVHRLAVTCSNLHYSLGLISGGLLIQLDD